MGPGFQSLLSGGDPRSLGRVDEVITTVLDDPGSCRELVDCLYGEDEIVRMRAADGLEKVAATQPGIVEPFLPELLGPVARIDQPSVKWHLAQIFAEVELGEADRRRATALVEGYLEDSRDWIVITCSMTTLTGFAASDAELRERLVPVLRLHLDSDRKAIAKRASKMLAELGETS